MAYVSDTGGGGRLGDLFAGLARDFSGGMATHAITDDIQPEVGVDKPGILIVVTLTTDVRRSEEL